MHGAVLAKSRRLFTFWKALHARFMVQYVPFACINDIVFDLTTAALLDLSAATQTTRSSAPTFFKASNKLAISNFFGALLASDGCNHLSML